MTAYAIWLDSSNAAHISTHPTETRAQEIVTSLPAGVQGGVCLSVDALMKTYSELCGAIKYATILPT